MCKKMIYWTCFVLVLGFAAAIANAVPLQQDSGPDGIVSVEAENYDNIVVGLQDEWQLVGPTDGFTGTAGMLAGPIDGTYSVITDFPDHSNSPRLDYEIEFVKTGTHYVWVRGWGADSGDDSCHVGLDYQAITTADRLDGFNGNYAWSPGTMDGPPATFEVPSPGLHILNIWMREDGFIIDKIVLTTNSNYTPTDDGPPESPRGRPEKASAPNPADTATDVPRDASLSWTPGIYAQTHDVYFGTVFDSINEADRTNPLGVLVSQDQDPNTYDPAGLLEFGQTYYWRIDEVNAPPDSTIFKSDIWSFTAELFAYPMENIIATASSSQPGAGPENTINGSGLDDDDLHSTDDAAMWLSSSDGPQPTWIQYEFDRTYKLYQMWVWNYNIKFEQVLGFGFKETTVEYSTNGTDWQALGDFEFAQGPSADGYAHNTTIDFGGVEAKYVKITANSNWSGMAQYGLSEVRFLYIPTHARQPQPASGQAGVSLDAVLSWRAGREAASHEVYVSSDMEAVINGTALVGTVTENNFELGSIDLELGKTYYWKINEVNEAESPSSWESDVWSFTITEYLTVDDFEQYDDFCNRIFYAWVDGFGHSGDPDCGVEPSDGNGTGSTVGNINAPFAEQTIVHEGKQSMPFGYANSAAPYYSETQREWATAQNWTRGGTNALTLWFYGDPDNSAESLYVAVQDSVGTIKVVIHDNPAALQQDRWQEWNINLTEFDDIDLSSVKTMYIGVGNRTTPQAGGSGTLYIDDIKLYPVSRHPVDPGTDNLMAYYAFENNIQDGSGNGLDGTTFGNPTYIEGPVGYGTALAFDGADEYVDLPIGSLISSLTDSTLSMWVNFSNTGGDWQRIFDFGTDTNVYMFLSPRTGSNGPMRFAITTTSSGGESQLDAPATLATGWHPVAVVIDGTSREMQLYLDGM